MYIRKKLFCIQTTWKFLYPPLFRLLLLLLVIRILCQQKKIGSIICSDLSSIDIYKPPLHPPPPNSCSLRTFWKTCCIYTWVIHVIFSITNQPCCLHPLTFLELQLLPYLLFLYPRPLNLCSGIWCL